MFENRKVFFSCVLDGVFDVDELSELKIFIITFISMYYYYYYYLNYFCLPLRSFLDRRLKKQQHLLKEENKL
jgi:hypothetical protein